MLLSFRFANHRSFADEQQLNLTPAYPSRDDLSHSGPAVPVAGIFGANASGKSNSLHALWFMRRMAIYSDRAVEPGLRMSLDRDPFLLDPEMTNTPSRYVVDLLLNDVRHTYGFAVDDEKIIEEWLYHYPLKKKRRIFEREGDTFLWGEETKKDADLENISNITSPAALFLSTAARFSRRRTKEALDPQPLHDVYRWFLLAVTRHRPGLRAPHSALGRMWAELGENRKAVIDLLKAADVGIVDVLLSEEPPQDAMFDIEKAVTEPAEFAPLRQRRQLQFSHKGRAGAALLGFQAESTGTQQLFDLALDATRVLRTGAMLTVDEIDASLHPMLTAKLINLFRSPKTNTRGSQLAFTSHDATLLGTFDTVEILGRDEIWFTEKDEKGASCLYPLTDFKPRREGENRQRRYLNGNYGGVPDLSWLPFERALATRGAAEADGEG